MKIGQIIIIQPRKSVKKNQLVRFAIVEKTNKTVVTVRMIKLDRSLKNGYKTTKQIKKYETNRFDLVGNLKAAIILFSEI